MLKELKDMDSIQKHMQSEGFHLFYFSRPACGVCTAIKEKVKIMLNEYPEVESYYINLDLVPEAAGQFSIFTIPALLLFSDGNELLREARYLSIDDIDQRIGRYYEMALAE